MTHSSWNDPEPGSVRRTGAPRDLDRAIDDAVRTLTSVDVDGSFRARVLDRIARRRQPRLAGLRVMLAGAACAAIVLAVVVSRPSAPAKNTPVGRSAAVEEPASAPPTAAVAAGTAERDRATPPAPHRPAEHVAADVLDDVPPDTIVAAVAEPTTDVHIVPLTELAPIAITPLEPAPIVSPDIAIAPLAPMAEVRVAPFAPLSERE